MKHDDDGRGGLVPVGDIPIDALGDRRCGRMLYRIYIYTRYHT